MTAAVEYMYIFNETTTMKMIGVGAMASLLRYVVSMYYVLLVEVFVNYKSSIISTLF